MSAIIGREEERALLSKIEQSGEPELVAVYGRRRVGKTFLIRNFFKQQLVFELSGLHHAILSDQLENFRIALSKSTGKLHIARPVNWLEAFGMLIDFLEPLVQTDRKVIFIDEFPWLHTPRSGFMQAFENFWNTWACQQKNLVVVICGSAAAWMIQNVMNNKGGLHNRVTGRIRLLPFTLGETEAFLKKRKVILDKYQILQLYMVMGGIPQYLKEIEAGESAMQAIDRSCFTKDGLLRNEFGNLFHSLFDEATYHISIIKALARRGMGLTRAEIIDACGLTTGGHATQLLDELTESGFITPYIPLGKTARENIYKLTDEYARFYLKFIERKRAEGAGAWISFSAGASWKIWSGIAFEGICMKHIRQIKKALGIEGVYTEASVWRSRPTKEEKGAQIDLLIDRQDFCINICEMKFSANAIDLSKSYADALVEKMHLFREHTRTRKTLLLTLITTFGIKNAGNYAGIIQNELKMDVLFK
jgi:uncharacterized protein